MALKQEEISMVVRRAAARQLGINVLGIQWGTNLIALGIDMAKLEGDVEDELGLPAFDNKILRARTVRDVTNAFWRRPLSTPEKITKAIFGP